MHTGNPAFKHRANKEPLIIDLMACTLKFCSVFPLAFAELGLISLPSAF